jgi:UDP-N-acetylmuramoylalanine--D-glutamate ligase
VAGGVYAIDGQLFDASENGARRVLDLRGAPALPGAHNWQNAAAAYAAGRALGLDANTIADGLRLYPGLAHRQELVGLIEGVRFVNDSKATNADAAAKALACYESIYWIAGGRPKEGGLAGLESFYPRIRHAFLIGEAAGDFAATLAGKVPATICGTLANAVGAAHEMARRDRRPGAVVLLSPACASFDQFANFEERGEAFRRLVMARSSTGRGGDSGRAALRAIS